MAEDQQEPAPAEKPAAAASEKPADKPGGDYPFPEGQDGKTAQPGINTRRRQADRIKAARKGGGKKFLLVGIVLVVIGVVLAVVAYFMGAYEEEAGAVAITVNVIAWLGVALGAVGLIGGLMKSN